MKKPFFLASLFFISLVNVVCTKDEQQQTAVTEKNGKPVTYLIKQGQHYSKPNPTVFTSVSAIIFDAVFDSSCIYTLTNTSNQNDINKLYGFSDCGTHHLENSARIGWRWSNDSLRIFAFVHNNGEMIYTEITTADIDSVIHCRITCLSSSYQFEVNGKIAELPRNCSGKYSRYKLYPYFGGDEAAPHDIRIQITEL